MDRFQCRGLDIIYDSSCAAQPYIAKYRAWKVSPFRTFKLSKQMLLPYTINRELRISRILRANLVHLARTLHKTKSSPQLWIKAMYNMTEEGGCMGKYNICEVNVQGGFAFHSWTNLFAYLPHMRNWLTIDRLLPAAFSPPEKQNQTYLLSTTHQFLPLNLLKVSEVCCC